MSTKILDKLQKKYEKELLKEGFDVSKDTVSVLGVMEQDRQAHLAQDLFERLIAEHRVREAKKVAWLMWYRFGIAQDGLFD